MKKIVLLLLLFIVLGGFFLRIYSVVTIPPGLNRDEAAIGYISYSLLKTGKDEHGVSWPISLKSFGDWKLPLYPYLTMAPVALFGLNEFATRFTSVILGVFSILIIYKIANQLFTNRKLALIAALLLAVSPWHIFFSRVASEANVAACVTLLAVLFILWGKKNLYWNIPGYVLLALSLITYAGAHVFTPLFFIVLFLGITGLRRNKQIFLSFFLFIVLSIIIYSQTLGSADATKISGLLPTNDISVVHEQIEKTRQIYSSQLLAKVFNNKFLLLGETVINNYALTFSPEFFYIKGGQSAQHNIPNFGNFYVVEAPFLLAGLYFLFARRQKYRWLLISWILLSPIGAAITRDAPHSARSYILLPAIVLVTAYGLLEIVNLQVFQKFKTGVIILASGLFLLNVSLFMSRYFIVFPYQSYLAWGDGYKKMIAAVEKYKSQYKEVVIARPDYSPYIYDLFYTKADPLIVQKELTYYPPTDEGFEHAASFGGITYKKINWSYELAEPNILYVDWANGMPQNATASAVILTKTEIAELAKNGRDVSTLLPKQVVVSKLVATIETPDHTPLFYLVGTRMGTPSAALYE